MVDRRNHLGIGALGLKNKGSTRPRNKNLAWNPHKPLKRLESDEQKTIITLTKVRQHIEQGGVTGRKNFLEKA
jgi:hypothetical protein